MEVSDSSSRILAGLLEGRTGQQLTLSRRWRIETALSSVLRARRIATLDELITLLVMGKDPGLADEVVEALLNNETYFFRDRTPFDTIRDQLLPDLMEKRAATRRIRIWSAGCSSGQEPYSLAMMFADDPHKWAGWNIEIYASDISGSIIRKARNGRYTQFEVQRGLGIQQTIRWFEEDEDGWVVSDKLRQMVNFETRNLLDDPPNGSFDLVLCRNVLLYLNHERRREAFDRIGSVVASDGALVLGAGETVIGQTELFAADRNIRGLYRLQQNENADRRAMRA
ncbi:CheR family methyltransferase [Sphingomicrobium marinum]|uniref:CheR family methyltransferase n=1 Tax=Sphingomicrobium marinum TaxID=1227950 RepID=UPI00223EE710|nr:protein-glutamate O-methyltransferase CheR [Sphingomicrobium marinum]